MSGALSSSDPGSVVQSTAEAAFATDDDGRVMAWNAAAERLLGFRADQAVGQRCHELLSGVDIFGNLFCRADCTVAAMVRSGKPVQGFKLDLKNAFGQYLRVDLSVVALEGAEPSHYSLIHIVRPSRRDVANNHFLERLRRGTRVEEGTTPSSAPPAPDGRPSSSASLTPREIDVLRLLAGGSSPQDIAETLGISINTVRTHIQSVLQKLEVHSVMQAVSKALQQRLI